VGRSAPKREGETVNLRDAKEQVEREQPHLTGTAKIEAIKALREQAKAAEPREEKPAPKPAGIGEAWAFLALVVIGMRVVSYFVWGGVMAQPHWYDVLYVVMLIAAISGLVSAYRKRGKQDS
jgi:hypothetical protein